MFLVGGPAFSGTTLLALMLNQGEVVCLDEPDFHNPQQLHRSIPLLRQMFPELSFPDHPGRVMTFSEATTLTEECERVLHPRQLGTKTCNTVYLGYQQVYRIRGYPVVAIFRDIRDALVRPLPEGFTESGLNNHYRMVWQHRDAFNLCLRYEDLVSDPDTAISQISKVLGIPLVTKCSWAPTDVIHHMLKLDKHELLKTLRLSPSRAGIWEASGKVFSSETHETARLMGY